MLDEAPKRGRLEFGAGLVVKRHGCVLSLEPWGLEPGTSVP
jgi:hypothetical protein